MSLDVRVMDQKTATEQAELHAQTILRAAGVAAEAASTDAGPMPCGADDAVEHLPDGGYSPYQIALAGGVADVPLDRLDPTILRAREGLRQAGWRIGALIPAANGRSSTQLTGENPADEFTFTIEALHDLNRLVLSVMSPCYQHPAA